MNRPYGQYLLVLLSILLFEVAQGQQLEIELIEDTLMTAEVHPTDPFIFHFETFNNGEETIIVDISKSNPEHPDDWDISICTVACLPPETDDAIFPIGGMLDEEVSIYFYPRSVGQGSVDIHMQSQEDSTETYDIRLYLNAALPTDISTNEQFPPHFRIEDQLFFDIEKYMEFQVHSVTGLLMASEGHGPGRAVLDLSHYPSGIYVISLIFDNGQMRQLKVSKP